MWCAARWQAIAILALASCGRVGFDAADPLTEGLVAWYPMESDPASSLGQDASGSGHHASCEGASCPLRAPGVQGFALQLDGVDDRFVVPDAPALHLDRAFTVTLWMQWFGGDAALIAKPQAMGTGASFEISVLPDKLLACTDDELGFDGESCLERPGSLPASTWIAIALTWDGVLRIVYLDGVQVTSGRHGAAFDGRPLLLGGDEHDGAPSSFHHGLLDEIRIYDRALTPLEVAALHAMRR